MLNFVSEFLKFENHLWIRDYFNIWRKIIIEELYNLWFIINTIKYN